MVNIIEFLALPAAGKSSLAQSLRVAHPDRFFSREEAETFLAHRRFLPHRYFLYFLILLDRRFLKYIFSPAPLRQAAYWVHRDRWLYEQLKASPKPVLLDEGYEQHLIFYASLSGMPADACRYLFQFRQIPPRVIIHLVTEDLTAAKLRLQQRGLPRSWKNSDEAKADSRMGTMAKGIAAALATLQKHTSVRIVHLENQTLSISESAAALEESLQGILEK